MAEQCRRFLQDDLGQDLVEYALLLAFVALASVAGMQALGGGVSGRYVVAASTMETAGDSDPGKDKPGKDKPPTDKPDKP